VANVVPLCREHHRECETLGQRTFEAKYRMVPLAEQARRLFQVWLGLPPDVRAPAF
jgi:hypothetical protein